MTTVLQLPPRSFIELRGDTSQRPTFRSDLRHDLQSELNDNLRAIVGPLTIDKSAINKTLACEGRYVAHDQFEWSIPTAKGTLVHKAIELIVGGLDIDQFGYIRIVQAALQRATVTNESLKAFIASLDIVDQLEMQNEVAQLVRRYAELFPVFKDPWYPNVEASTSAWIGHKRVIFRGKIDLKLGRVVGGPASSLLIDFKTGGPSSTDMDDLRFYALLETLRTGIPPYRWANVYLATGQIISENADEDALWKAVDRTIEGTRKIARLKDGGEAQLTPGDACRFCPAMLTCMEAVL